MKRLALIAIPVLAIILVVVFLLAGSKANLQVSGPLSTNARFAHPVSQTHYYYFNGSAFADYDTQAHTSTPLTDIYNLPNITEVRWSSDGALFKASGYSPADQLYPILANAKADTSDLYWWQASFATKKITLVGSPSNAYKVQDAIWSGTSIVYADALTNPDVDTQPIYQLSNGTSKVLGRTKRLSQLFWTDGTKLLFQSTDNSREVIEQTLSGNTQVSIIKDATPSVYVSPGGNSIVYISTNQTQNEGSAGPSGILKLLDRSTSKTSTINKKFSGDVLWDGDRWLAADRQADGSLQIQWVSPKNKQQSVSLVTKSKEYLTVSGFHDDQIVLVGSGNAAYVASPQAITPPAVNTSALASIQDSLYEDNFYSTYDKPTDTYTVYVLKSPYAANVQQVLQYFASKDLDPYQLNIKWYAYDNVPLSS